MTDAQSGIYVERSDLEKVVDALERAVAHHRLRDAANAELHLAKEVRYSPLTSMLEAECGRAVGLLNG